MIEIGYIAGKKMLAIRCSDEGFRIPKSGTIKVPGIIRELTKK